MLLAFLLSLSKPRAFVWAPALDLSDNAIFSALIPGTHS